MNNSATFTEAELAALGPAHLHHYRATRYFGDDISVTLDDFDPTDRGLVQEQYATLQPLLALLRSNLDRPEQGLRAAQSFAREVGWLQFIKRVRGMGGGATRPAQPRLLDQVIHDLRGGAFQALSIQLQLIGLGVSQPDDLARMFFLTRDHLKIMRNAVRDIDPAGYERDRAERLHSVGLLLEKWQGAYHRASESAARVSVDCRFAGNVSERCLEFAALDRVLYNLMNNAARNAADRQVALVVLPVNGDGDGDLRFVIANQVSAEQHRILMDRYEQDLGALFRGGFTTGGSGIGMRICADFVSNAYGLGSPDQAIAERYVGARLLNGRFVSWFHWPIAAD